MIYNTYSNLAGLHESLTSQYEQTVEHNNRRPVAFIHLGNPIWKTSYSESQSPVPETEELTFRGRCASKYVPNITSTPPKINTEYQNRGPTALMRTFLGGTLERLPVSTSEYPNT
jgi:hypothetical protein